METLKAAVDYIRALKEMLGEQEEEYSGPIQIMEDSIGESRAHTDHGG